MDAGIAGILGAAIGGGAVAVSGFVNGWFALRTTRTQLEAQQTQAQQQMRSDHLRERRDSRSTTYIKFVAQAELVQEAVIRTGTRTNMSPMLVELQELGKCRARVAIEGPAEVAARAAEVYRVVSNSFTHVAFNQESLTAWGLQVAAALGPPIEGFSASARAALEDYGAEPHLPPPG